MAKRNLTLEFSLEEYDSPEDLPAEDLELLTEAKKYAEHSYSPYSNFKVGACLRLKDGTLFGGSNQENIAYPSGLCGESISILAAGAQYPDIPIESLAVTTISGETDELVTPCGVCRQVIAEYELRYSTPIRIIMRGKTGKVYVVPSIKALLPLMFEHGEVKKPRA